MAGSVMIVFGFGQNPVAHIIFLGAKIAAKRGLDDLQLDGL